MKDSVLAGLTASWKTSMVNANSSSPHSTPPSISVLIYFSKSPLICLLQVLLQGMPLPTQCRGKTSCGKVDAGNFCLVFTVTLMVTPGLKGFYKMADNKARVSWYYSAGAFRLIIKRNLEESWSEYNWQQLTVCDKSRIPQATPLCCAMLTGGKCRKVPQGSRYKSTSLGLCGLWQSARVKVIILIIRPFWILI